MKQAISLTLLIILATVSFGQAKEQPIKKIYLQLGGGLTSNNGVSAELGIQAILKKNWSMTFSYQNIQMDPKNLPSDYEPGYTILIIIPVPDALPSADMNLVSLTAGKFFPTGRKTWFTTEAGLSVVSGDKMNFTPQPVISDYVYTPSNYATTKERQTSIGALLKADFNWAFCPYVGLGAGAFANFNSIQSPIGFQVKLIAGWMNSKKKH
jgi:hypothetical protein